MVNAKDAKNAKQSHGSAADYWLRKTKFEKRDYSNSDSWRSLRLGGSTLRRCLGAHCRLQIA
jgi:hypothetical protein